jgi:hypothetical protein
MELCSQCKNVLAKPQGDRITGGWTKPEGPESLSLGKLLAPFVCVDCGARWMRIRDANNPSVVRWRRH